MEESLSPKFLKFHVLSKDFTKSTYIALKNSKISNCWRPLPCQIEVFVNSFGIRNLNFKFNAHQFQDILKEEQAKGEREEAEASKFE